MYQNFGPRMTELFSVNEEQNWTNYFNDDQDSLNNNSIEKRVSRVIKSKSKSGSEMSIPQEEVVEEIGSGSLGRGNSAATSTSWSDSGSDSEEPQYSRERCRDPNLRKFLAYRHLMNEIDPRFEKSRGIMRKHQDFQSRNADDIDETDLLKTYKRTKIFINNFQDYVSDALMKISNLPARQFPPSCEDKNIGTETDSRCQNAKYEQLTQLEHELCRNFLKLQKPNGNSSISPDLNLPKFEEKIKNLSWEQINDKIRNLNVIMKEAIVKVIRIKQILESRYNRVQSNASTDTTCNNQNIQFFVHKCINALEKLKRSRQHFELLDHGRAEKLNMVLEQVGKMMENIQKSSEAGQVGRNSSNSGNSGVFFEDNSEEIEYRQLTEQLEQDVDRIKKESKSIKMAKKLLKASETKDAAGESLDQIVQKSNSGENLSYPDSTGEVENEPISFWKVKLDTVFENLDQLDEKLDEILKNVYFYLGEPSSEVDNESEFEIDCQSVSQGQGQDDSISENDEDEPNNDRFEMDSNFVPENLHETLSHEIFAQEFQDFDENDAPTTMMEKIDEVDEDDEKCSSPIALPKVKNSPRLDISSDIDPNEFEENENSQGLEVVKKSTYTVIPTQNTSTEPESTQIESQHDQDSSTSENFSNIVNWLKNCDTEANVDDNEDDEKIENDPPYRRQELSTFETIFGLSPRIGYGLYDDEVDLEASQSPLISSRIKEKAPLTQKITSQPVEIFRQESKNVQESAAGLSTYDIGNNSSIQSKRGLFVQEKCPSSMTKYRISAGKMDNLDNQNQNDKSQNQIRSMSRIPVKIRQDFNRTRSCVTPRNPSSTSNTRCPSNPRPTSISRMTNSNSRPSTFNNANSTRFGQNPGQKSSFSFSSNPRPTTAPTTTNTKMSGSRPPRGTTNTTRNAGQNPTRANPHPVRATSIPKPISMIPKMSGSRPSTAGGSKIAANFGQKSLQKH